jgi:transketolase
MGHAPPAGFGFVENKFEWHGKPPTAEEAKVALAELRSLGGRIVGEHQ